MSESSETVGLDCTGCSHFSMSDSICVLRQVVIAAPEDSACASHPAHGPLRRPFAIGPVLQNVGGEVNEVHASPDDRRIRDRLLDLIEDIHVRGTQPLSAREATVVWQLREFGEPRAIHHLDRIDAATVINRARADGRMPPTLTLFGAARQIVAAAVPELARGPAVEPHSWLLHFSAAGRLLLLSTLLVGIAAFVLLLLAEVSLWHQVGAGYTVLHLGALGAVAAAIAIAWLWAGKAMLRRLEIPFSSAAVAHEERRS